MYSSRGLVAEPLRCLGVDAQVVRADAAATGEENGTDPPGTGSALAWRLRRVGQGLRPLLSCLTSSSTPLLLQLVGRGGDGHSHVCV
jgi:hypothetical protein